MSEKAAMPESVGPPVQNARSKWLVPVVAVIVAVAVIAATLFVYYSPEYSWDASIRDHDGDGYPDDADAFPYDATEWTDTDGDGVGDNAQSSQPPISSIVRMAPAPSYGVKYQFAPFSKDTAWSDVTILLMDGSGNTASFAPVTENLDNGTTAKYNFASKSLGSLTVFCNVTDLAGNGYVNSGDYFTFTTTSSATFSASVTYTATIMHDPTAAEVCHASFQGT